MSLDLFCEHRGAMEGVRAKECHDQTDFRMNLLAAKQRRCLWGPLGRLWLLSREGLNGLVVVRMERSEQILLGSKYKIEGS